MALPPTLAGAHAEILRLRAENEEVRGENRMLVVVAHSATEAAGMFCGSKSAVDNMVVEQACYGSMNVTTGVVPANKQRLLVEVTETSQRKLDGYMRDFRLDNPTYNPNHLHHVVGAPPLRVKAVHKAMNKSLKKHSCRLTRGRALKIRKLNKYCEDRIREVGQGQYNSHSVYESRKWMAAYNLQKQMRGEADATKSFNGDRPTVPGVDLA